LGRKISLFDASRLTTIKVDCKRGSPHSKRNYSRLESYWISLLSFGTLLNVFF